MSSKIDAVLPITISDVDRAWILLRSLERFGEAIGRLWIVAPSSDLERIQSKCISSMDVVFLSDDELVPLWSRMTRINRFCPLAGKQLYGRGMRGWYVQQLIKFAIADRIETPFYLTLDADMFLTRALCHDDFVCSGKGIWQRGKTTGLSKWNRWAARVLDVPESPWVSGVTPALFSREAVMELRSFLSDKRLSIPGRLRARLTLIPPDLDWQSFLMQHLPWTEFALYLTYLESRHSFDRFHWDAGDIGLYDNSLSVWTDEDWRNWNPQIAFSSANTGWFVVVQNFLRPGAIEIWDKVGPYLQCSEQA